MAGMTRLRGALVVATRTRSASSALRSSHPLAALNASLDSTLLRELHAEEGDEELLSTETRNVTRGHFVFTEPAPVPTPKLSCWSASVASDLGIEADLDSDAERAMCASVLSGNELLPNSRPWATAYGCSIAGKYVGHDAYGDGRAQSLGEAVTPSAGRLELQLKGCGPTAFSRGFDGRSVLRSSMREFVASEAMGALGVPSSRALSLVTHGLQIARAWYPPVAPLGSSTAEDGTQPTSTVRLPHSPETMVREQGAVVCRVAPSFLRVAHFELIAARLQRAQRRKDSAAVLAHGAEYNALLTHALRREFPDIDVVGLTVEEQTIALFDAHVARQAVLVAEWMRVGYVQGNWNSDNVALGGRTLDFGPFGFMEKYDSKWNPWTGDGDGKYAYGNQPQAGLTNAVSLAQALLVCTTINTLDDGGSAGASGTESAAAAATAAVAEGHMITALNLGLERYSTFFAREHGLRCARKLGLSSAGATYDELLQLMQTSGSVDYTALFRDLAAVSTSQSALDAVEASPSGERTEELLRPLRRAGVGGSEGDEAELDAWTSWMRSYTRELKAEGRSDAERRAEQKAASPAVVPRAWMLALAYTKAENGGDMSAYHAIRSALEHPYADRDLNHSPSSSGLDWRLIDACYSPSPPWAEHAPGLAFMS